MTIIDVNGNIMNATQDIIGHQVNCMGVMEAGIAEQISLKYMQVYTHYMKLVNSKYNKRDLLGECQLIKVKDRYIANLFGQYNYGSKITKEDVEKIHYKSLHLALVRLKFYARKNNLSVALPHKMGCRHAKGNWKLVRRLIDLVFGDYDVYIYKLK